jgi:hypothetical protein
VQSESVVSASAQSAVAELGLTLCAALERLVTIDQER